MNFQVEKLEHFRYILPLEFNREAKAAEMARNITPCMETMPSETTARKWLSRFKEDPTLVALHVQEDLWGLMEII